MGEAWLWSTWVKAGGLRNADIAIVAACLPFVNPGIYQEVTRGKVALLACPEREHPALYGKIASIIRSSRPRSITIVSIDGSPHCFQLHAAVNEAEYILGEAVERRHYVVVDGERLVEVSPNAVRVARYLHLVDRFIRDNPSILKELERHSLEYRRAIELAGKQGST